MNISKTRHFVYLALFSAMAIVLSIIESIYIGPIFFMVRIGLANIVALVTIKILGVKEMIIVNAMRVVIANLMRGLIFGSTFWISLGGVVLSSVVLILLDKMKSSLMFTSILCSIAHSVGQVIVVCMFYMQPRVAAILPYLLAGSIPMGVITGFTAKLVLSRIKPLRKEHGLN
ncbi:MAG: Gx transporter family protein [Solobacterium sp.]|nr:Gx transporter family protein [Solobacterium sp.]